MSKRGDICLSKQEANAIFTMPISKIGFSLSPPSLPLSLLSHLREARKASEGILMGKRRPSFKMSHYMKMVA